MSLRVRKRVKFWNRHTLWW